MDSLSQGQTLRTRDSKPRGSRPGRLVRGCTYQGLKDYRMCEPFFSSFFTESIQFSSNCFVDSIIVLVWLLSNQIVLHWVLTVLSINVLQTKAHLARMQNVGAQGAGRRRKENARTKSTRVPTCGWPRRLNPANGRCDCVCMCLFVYISVKSINFCFWYHDKFGPHCL